MKLWLQRLLNPLYLAGILVGAISISVGLTVFLIAMTVQEVPYQKINFNLEQLTNATPSDVATILGKLFVVSEKNEIILSNLIIISVILVIMSLLVVIIQSYFWSIDRKKILHWKENGILYERLEFLDGGRIRIDHIEMEINKAQLQTLLDLARKRLEGTPLHPLDLNQDNAAQAIKRLREELGSRLLEKTFIKNHRGKGYWLDIEPANIKLKSL